MSVAPDAGYRLTRGLLIGKCAGLGVAALFALTPDLPTALVVFPVFGGWLGWMAVRGRL